MSAPSEHFRLCSSCKKPLLFERPYYVCSVSTCNRTKMPYTFCSVACWQAHVPVMNHRDAWAEERRKTRAEFEAEQHALTESAIKSEERQSVARSASAVRPAAADNHPKAASKEPNMSNEEVLIVVSKVKSYIKAKAGMNTADAVSQALSDVVRKACDEAIERAKADGRKTVMLRDVTGNSEG